MITILWTIYWTGFTYSILDTMYAALAINAEEGHKDSGVHWPLSVLLTSALWPLGRALRINGIIHLSRAKGNG